MPMGDGKGVSEGGQQKCTWFSMAHFPEARCARLQDLRLCARAQQLYMEGQNRQRTWGKVLCIETALRACPLHARHMNVLTVLPCIVQPLGQSWAEPSRHLDDPLEFQPPAVAHEPGVAQPPHAAAGAGVPNGHRAPASAPWRLMNGPRSSLLMTTLALARMGFTHPLVPARPFRALKCKGSGARTLALA